ncbi:hypothetical protein O0I10_001722 [Lichtheimia ornata]|uniref:U2 snRNP-associated SURP motif-containing protein n=1 Tax=Lichtheimia ornata TaxID=688661 RepID=A0AAD7VCH1_9FUNG|nr:uncharacterized protein O0I10_001722 [Lichtheimia ornata]KAJ8662758.1 hypothetical protein O0I10_001722 [Lichtheimia ornata]
MNDDKRSRRSTSRSTSPSPPPRKTKPIAPTKLQAFTVGTHKKTPFQRHKEEIELKKKRESEEAAKVYEEFVASFEDPHSYKDGTQTFVKSSTMIPRGDEYEKQQHASKKHQPSSSSSIKTTSSISASPSKPSYKAMPFIKAGEAAKTNPLSLKRSKPMQEDEDDDEDDALAMKEARAHKKRNMDTFLEEIKKEQEDREDRLRSRNAHKSTAAGDRSAAGASDSAGITLKAAFEERPGSHDIGDPLTTNLYVGNINPAVNEMMICHEFGKYGPIASVKIMWPRTQEERERNRNCGFVSFMKRPDAEQALKNLDGKTFHDFVMKVGWGKAVPLPATPVFVLDKSSKSVQTGLPFNAQVVDTQTGMTSKPRAQITVVKPSNMQQVKIIHRMVERVIRNGSAFEAIIMEREKDNPKFKFLFDNRSEEHIYYRWRLYSIMQGDTRSQWRTEPFQMFEGGPWWVPPDVPFDDEGMNDILLDTDDEERERDREHVPKGTLGKIAKQRFEIMLRQVTFQRGTIARAMAFAIDHADAADEVIDIVIKSLIIPETPITLKLARLYLVSDILHNSGTHVANAWKYRAGLEGRLVVVFEHFNEIYRSISARLKAEQLRRHISTVLSAWENWMVFPQHHIDNWNGIFMKKSSSNTSESESRSASPESILTESQASVPAAAAASTSELMEEDNDVDGEPIPDDVDGVPMESEDVDGEPLEPEDVDGVPLDEGDMVADDDIDGEPLQEDDQAPVNEDQQQVPSSSDIDDMFAPV